MMDVNNEILGLIFGGLGLIVSMFSIFISLAIYTRIETNRKSVQYPYKIITESNMKSIHEYFNDILRILKNYDGEYTDEYDESMSREERERLKPLEITENLASFFQIHAGEMNVLLENSKHDLGLWVDLKKERRLKYNKIIKHFNWLINNFYHDKNDDEIRIRIWTRNYDELMSIKHEIDQFLLH